MNTQPDTETVVHPHNQTHADQKLGIDTPARQCDLCEQLFTPEPFADPEICEECLEINEYDE